MKNIAIITSHPIQYNAPFFKSLHDANFAKVKVFYTGGLNLHNTFDPGFGMYRSWDIDLLFGYEYVFVQNVSLKPGSHHYKGIVNPDLIELVSSFNPDAIVVYGWKFHSHLKLMRYFKGRIPIYFRGDSTLLDDPRGFSVQQTLRRWALKWIYRHIDFALSPGSASDHYFLSAGVPMNSIIRMPHAVDNKRFDSSSRDSVALRTAISIPDHHFVFLFVGKLIPKKDPVILLDAFARLHAINDSVILIYAGTGELEPLLRKYAVEKGIEHCVHFLGFINQTKLPEIYAIADTLVLTSKGPGETWGLVINEAMASGIPAIASDRCGASSDMINDGINGFIFKSGSESALFNRMQQIIQLNPNKTKLAAKETADRFSYQSCIESLKTIDL